MPTLLSRFLWIFSLILIQVPPFSVYAQEPSFLSGQEINDEGPGFLTPNSKVRVGANGESCCGKDPTGHSDLHDPTGADGVSPKPAESGVQ